MAKRDDADEPGKAEPAETGEYGLEDIAGMPQQKDPDWLQGFIGSSPAEANAPNYPGNQVWDGDGIGTSAEQYKAHWKNKPKLFPYGTNNDGGV